MRKLLSNQLKKLNWPGAQRAQERLINHTNGRFNLHAALLRHFEPVQDVGALDAEYAPVEVRRLDAAQCTIFAFGGMAHAFTMPVREFFGVLSVTPSNVLFIKDFHQAWYQKGLLGTTTSRAETIAFLEARFSDMPRPWIFTGSSAGGHAAIHFGQAMGADRVVAFGPQSYVDAEVWRRDRPDVAPEVDFDFADPELDLAHTLAAAKDGGNCHIHFGEQNQWDQSHAERLAGLPGVTLHTHATEVHAIARFLRKRDALTPAIFGDTVPVASAAV